MAGAEIQRSYAKGVVHIDLNFGGPLSGPVPRQERLGAGTRDRPPIVQCRNAGGLPARSRRQNPASATTTSMTPSTAGRRAMPLHCVAIDANPETGLILGLRGILRHPPGSGLPRP